MITVAGFNTAIDRSIHLDVLQPGAVQRARTAQACPGGKGLHVAQTVVALGGQARLVGLTDKVHDAMLAQYLRERGVEWFPVEQSSGGLRQCLAVHESNGRITEILEPGSPSDAAQRQALLDTLYTALEGSDALVLTGSLPQGLPDGTYADLIRKAGARHIPCLVDASGAALQHAVEAGPWLVKPNEDEAAALSGHPLHGVEGAATCARWLHARGVSRAVVTLGADGAVGFDGTHLWHATLDMGMVRNPVGSGDCFLAALAIGTVHDEPLDVVLRRAVASGAGNASGEESGYVTAARVAELMPHVQLEHLCVSKSDGGDWLFARNAGS